jgi:hypothetical protein
MTETLNIYDIESLESHLSFRKELSLKMLKKPVLIIVGATILAIFFKNLSLLIAIGPVALIFIFISYQISYKVMNQLKKDLKLGYKNIEQLAVKKISKKRTSQEVIMNNGLRIGFAEFQIEGVNCELITEGDIYWVEYTPNNNFILKISKMNESKGA